MSRRELAPVAGLDAQPVPPPHRTVRRIRALVGRMRRTARREPPRFEATHGHEPPMFHRNYPKGMPGLNLCAPIHGELPLIPDPVSARSTSSVRRPFAIHSAGTGKVTVGAR